LIGLDIFEDIDTPSDPQNRDLVDLLTLSQAEVEPPTVMTLVASSAADFIHQFQVAGHDSDVGAHPVAIALRAPQFDCEPVALVR
jgi:hypothetical protein